MSLLKRNSTKLLFLNRDEFNCIYTNSLLDRFLDRERNTSATVKVEDNSAKISFRLLAKRRVSIVPRVTDVTNVSEVMKRSEIPLDCDGRLRRILK